MMLALRMGRTLGELCQSMSSAEFSLWIEAYRDDQWGEKRDDWRAGVVASTVANFAGRQLASNASSTKPEDFMPKFGADDECEAAEPDPVAYFTAIANNQPYDKG
jgi:hypothetical protein